MIDHSSSNPVHILYHLGIMVIVVIAIYLTIFLIIRFFVRDNKFNADQKTKGIDLIDKTESSQKSGTKKRHSREKGS